MSNERDVFDRAYKEKRKNDIAKNQNLTSNLISSINRNLLKLNNKEEVIDEKNNTVNDGNTGTDI